MEDYILLLGKNEEYLREFMLKNSSIKYKISYTKDTKHKEEKVEGKVIRIKNTDGVLDVLFGFFSVPNFN
ncbi:MAG: hypothetical protein PHI90_09225 [Clostridia bacterium]|nr:hypothetical protein [Clostridia bacterium]MDD4048979.1 hypothetical protein [Clostridia bacterium]